MMTSLDVLDGFLQKEYAMVAIAAVNPFPTQYEQKLVWDKIQSIDLSPVHAKLMDREKWSLDYCKNVEEKYKGFLYLAYCHQNAQLIPSEEIDVMWHVHILHTKKYAADCLMSLGFFLHHRPDDGSGMITDSDRQFTADAFASIGMEYIIPSECSGGTKCSSCTI